MSRGSASSSDSSSLSDNGDLNNFTFNQIFTPKKNHTTNNCYLIAFPLSQKMAMRSPVTRFFGSLLKFRPNGVIFGELSTNSSARRRSMTQFIRDLRWIERLVIMDLGEETRQTETQNGDGNYFWFCWRIVFARSERLSSNGILIWTRFNSSASSLSENELSEDESESLSPPAAFGFCFTRSLSFLLLSNDCISFSDDRSRPDSNASAFGNSYRENEMEKRKPWSCRTFGSATLSIDWICFRLIDWRLIRNLAFCFHLKWDRCNIYCCFFLFVVYVSWCWFEYEFEFQSTEKVYIQSPIQMNGLQHLNRISNTWTVRNQRLALQ